MSGAAHVGLALAFLRARRQRAVRSAGICGREKAKNNSASACRKEICRLRILEISPFALHRAASSYPGVIQLLLGQSLAPEATGNRPPSADAPAQSQRRLHSLLLLRQRQTTYPVPLMTTPTRPSPPPMACISYLIDKRPISPRQRPKHAKTSHEPRSTSPSPFGLP